ncbi:MAG TPA: response regulator transcription factor [Acidimicrobiales bacterium]|nr:response regulator transcription factor [Acidimicrobiales bacterium]
MSVALRSSESVNPVPDAGIRILVIDGDASSREMLAAGLEAEGFEVVLAHDGHEGIRLLTVTRPSLVLLDMFLPDQSGMAVFRRIEAVSALPVIMVAAKDDEIDAVLSLEAGAADHVTKPFRLRELTARVRAVLRRVETPSATGTPDNLFESGPVKIDVSMREVTVRGIPVELSRKELDLLVLLVSEAGHVVTRTQCMDHLWRDRRLADSRTLDTHIKRVRKKIELDPGHPEHILTIRGIGYRFRA